MAIASLDQIREFVRAFQGRPSVFRDALEGLAIMCGLDDKLAVAASLADLKALYETVKKRPESGYQVAQRIARKHGEGNPLDSFLSPPQTPSEAAPEVAKGGPTADQIRVVMEKVAVRLDDEFRKYVGEKVNPIADEQAEHDRRIAELAEVMDTEYARVLHEVAEQIPAAVDAAIKSMTPTQLVVTMPEATPVVLGLVHYATADIIKALAANLNVYLHGPAGSGKTTVARKCAEAFGLPFYTAAKVESEYLLLGFKDAQGQTVRTQFREAYEHGGVFLFDELDASSPGAVVAMNMALANGVCPFPDGNVKRHESFKCIAAGNTVLSGATHAYAGRNQLDAASVDRFFFIEFGYDEQLELAIASNRDWALYVQAVRQAVKERGLRHLVTPRATLDAALAAGFTWEQAEAACVYKGLDHDTIGQVRSAAVRLQNAA